MTDLGFTPKPLPANEVVYPWESQASQYAIHGKPGIGYERHYADGTDTGPTNPVDCLLYRGDPFQTQPRGVLLGILNHYPEGDVTGYVEQPGNVNIWVHPWFQRQGIATALLAEARKRWAVNLAQQRYSASGLAFITSIIERERA